MFNWISSAAGAAREDVNMLWQHDRASDAAATARQSDERAMERTQDFNSAEALKNREFQERMSGTQYQRSMSDMRAAGLNPMLAASQGGAGTPSGSAASASGTKATPAQVPSYRASDLSHSFLNSAMVARTEAETSKIRAEEGEIKARTLTHAASIEKMRQEILESQERINKIMAEVNATVQGERTSAASQHLHEQQRRNLQAELPRIKAQAEQLIASTTAAYAQERHLSAQETEVRQRIRANLPELERVLKNLERFSRVAAQPGQVQQAIVDDSWIGSWNRIIRGIFGQPHNR